MTELDEAEIQSLVALVATGHGILLTALLGTAHAAADVEMVSTALRWAMHDHRLPVSTTTRALAIIGAAYLPALGDARQLMVALALAPIAHC